MITHERTRSRGKYADISQTASARTKEMSAAKHFPAMHFAGERPPEEKTDAVCICMQRPLKPKMNAAAGNDGAPLSEKSPPVISRSPLRTEKSVPSNFEKSMKLTVRHIKKFAHIAAMDRIDEKMHFENTVYAGRGEKLERAFARGSFFCAGFSLGRINIPVMSEDKR